MTPPVPVVILAAGASRRLGRPKQLVPFRGRTLLAHAVATARAAGCGPVFVVRGSRADTLQGEATGATLVENPDWGAGIGTSIRVAVAAIESELPGATAGLFTVCDQPFVTPELLAHIAEAHTRGGHGLVAAAYSGTVGVPALFARQYFNELKDLPGEVGAKRVLARHASAVHALPFPEGAVDVDTETDAELLARGPETP